MREGNNRVAIVLLARSFHALEHAACLDPWNPDALYHWAVEHLHTDAERHCARFVLSVWNRDVRWSSTSNPASGPRPSITLYRLNVTERLR